MSKTGTGNFFEDFQLGQEIRHATPRTVERRRRRPLPRPDRLALPAALLATRSPALERPAGGARSRTCWPSISSSARRSPTSRSTPWPISATPTGASWAWSIPGDTIQRPLAGDRAQGDLERPDRHRLGAQPAAGRTDGTPLVDYVRWVMVRKRDPALAGAGARRAPSCPTHVAPERLVVPAGLRRDQDRPGGDRLALLLRGLCGRREDRPCRRHGRDGERAPARHPALPERCAGALQRPHRAAGPAGRLHRLRRRRDLARPGAFVQRPGQLPAHAGDQRRQPRQSLPRRRHGLCLVGGAGHGRACRAAPTSAPCACGWSRPRTGPATTSRCKDAEGRYLPEILLDLDYWALIPAAGRSRPERSRRALAGSTGDSPAALATRIAAARWRAAAASSRRSSRSRTAARFSRVAISSGLSRPSAFSSMRRCPGQQRLASRQAPRSPCSSARLFRLTASRGLVGAVVGLLDRHRPLQQRQGRVVVAAALRSSSAEIVQRRRELGRGRPEQALERG